MFGLGTNCLNRQHLTILQVEYKKVIKGELKKAFYFLETLDQALGTAIEFSSISYDSVPEIEFVK